MAVDNFVPKTAYYDQPVLPLNNAPAPKRYVDWRRGCCVPRAPLTGARSEYVELALNPSNPTGHVWKMPENEDIHSLFPLLTNNVFPLSHVATLADMTQVDIYGVISFVGRLQVENVRETSAWLRWLTSGTRQGAAEHVFAVGAEGVLPLAQAAGRAGQRDRVQGVRQHAVAYLLGGAGGGRHHVPQRVPCTLHYAHSQGQGCAAA